MTTPESKPTDTPQEAVKPNDDKERNFRALEARYQRQLQEEQRAKAELEKRLAALEQSKNSTDDDDDDEPYVDKKRLARQFSSFERQLEEKFEKKAEEKARYLMQQDKQQNWLKSNNDFYDVMKHADKLAEEDPELAETILNMPDTFDRQRLVYRTIKKMRLHEEKPKEPSIQDTINQRRSGAYYQPSGTGTNPYATQGDFSKKGKKDAYEQMQALKARLRLG